MTLRPGPAVWKAARLISEPKSVSIRRYSVCQACRIASPARSTPAIRTFNQTSRTQRQLRPLSTTQANLKKSSTNPKSQRKSPPVEISSKSEHIPDNKHTRNQDAEPDPYDHSILQSAIDQAIARLKDALSKTRDAGRVSTTMIEDLPVDLNVKGSPGQGSPSSHKERTRIGDIASVVPKGGRTMQVYAAEEAHVRPLQHAIQASPYSLTPQQPDPGSPNPLLLVVPVPPATAETRTQAAAEAKKCFDRAGLEVRNARGDAQKRHKKMEQEKMVVPDELRKAHKGMEDVARRGQDEVKRVYEAALKALQNV